MFLKDDKVMTTRKIRAGLREDGPFVCAEGVAGEVIEVEPSEPDGVRVRLPNGSNWWFKPSQLSRVV
jgi:hypothetical protein